MEISEKFKEIYKKAKEIDSKLERETIKNNGGGLFIPRNLVTRNLDRIILLENEIKDLMNKIVAKQKEIHFAKNSLLEYGIDIEVSEDLL